MLEVEKITESGALEAHLHPSDSTAGLSAISEPIDTRGKTALALDEAVKVMVEALGLSPKAVAGVPPTQVLQTAGQLLREFVTGLQLLQQRQTDLLQMFNLSGSDSDSGGNNPLRFATDLGPALKYLLGSRGDSYLDSQDGVRDALSAIDMRQQAMIKAMCHALEDYLKHFDPDAVKSRVSETRKRGPRLQGSNKSRYWENYEKAFSVLTRHNEKHIPKQFAEEFARAYKIEILSLKEGES
jgi:type VI secretion system FHA domain protein